MPEIFHIFRHYRLPWNFLIAQMVKNVPIVQETQVRSLGQEDPLEKEMATHTHIPAWRIPWTEEPGGYSGVAESDMAKQLKHTHTDCLMMNIFVQK